MQRFRSVAAVVCAALVTATGLAIAPPPATAQSVPELKLEKYTLPNGLQVILHEDHKLPVVNVNLWYHVGSKNEEAGRTGFAHLFEHMMFQGSKHVDGEYLTMVERAGANLREGGVNGTTNNDRTNYFETVPSESLEYALWLESDRMGFLLDKLTPESFENQQNVVKNEKRQGENAPYGRWYDVLNESMFPAGHPYSWPVIGSMDDLTAATVDDVKQFFRTYYTPNNATLTLVGDFQPAKAKALIEKYFGPIAPGPALERPKLWTPSLNGEKRVVVADRVPLQRLSIAYPGVAYFQPGEADLDIASQVLAGGKNSRLYKALVYDRQLAANVNVYNITFEIAGMVVVDVIARPGSSLDEIESIVDAEIAKFAKDGPTAEEVAAAKIKIETQFVAGLEQIGGFGGKADIINRYNTFLGSPDFLAKDVERYRAASPTSVRDTTNRVMNTKNRLILTVTPETSGRPETAEFDRTKVPAFGKRDPFQPSAPTTRTLANGLQVMVVERHDIPTVSAQFVTKSGSVADPVDKSGTAFLTAAMLDEGTTTRSALDISNELDKLGATLGTNAGTESSVVTAQVLSRNIKPLMTILADVVLHPAFPAADLERQRKQRLDAIAQAMEDPGALAANTFPKLVYGEAHPYGRQVGGDAASVAAIKDTDLKAFHETRYKPNNSALILVGDITIDQATKLAEEFFGSWAKGTVPAVQIPAPKTPTENVVYLIDRQDAPQSQIRIGSLGINRTSPDYYGVDLMNTILGGYFSGRLNLNLREDKGYSYGAFSGFNERSTYGHWSASAGVQTNTTKESLVEFERELRGIAGERPITAQELADAKANLVRGYAQQFETNAQVAGEISTLFVYGLPLDSLGKYESAIDALTPEQVAAMAKKYVDASKTVILVVGDRSKIEEGVRSLNLGKVVVLDASGKPIAD